MANSQFSKGRTVQGAMPCGNPKRYASRDVIQMSHGGKKVKTQEEEFKTESERHIETMVHQQLNTDISLSGHFSQHRDFSPASSHDPGVNRLVGLTAYTDYKQVEELDARIDELRHCGLTDEEIALKMRQDMKEQISDSHSGFGADPTIQAQRMAEIENRIKMKAELLDKPDSYKGALELSRHSRDLEKSIAQRYQKESVLPKSMTTCKKFEETHRDDPINKIGEILREVEGKKERESRRDKRKRRKQERRKEYYSQFVDTVDKHDVSNMGEQEDITKLKSDSGSENDQECMLPQPREFYVNCDKSEPQNIQQTASDDKSSNLSCVTNKCVETIDSSNTNNDTISVKITTTDSTSRELTENEGSPLGNNTVISDRLTKPSEQSNLVDCLDSNSSVISNTTSSSKISVKGSSTSGKSDIRSVQNLQQELSERRTLNASSESSDKPGQERILKQILNSISFVNEEDILKNRLTETEIKEMEKFKNYERGAPSPIVYVKNLPPKVSEEDLISLFGRFQSTEPSAQKIVYKLLTGRMKGQGFITFPDASVAEKAIDLVNGYKLRDRPIILCFGKKQS